VSWPAPSRRLAATQAGAQAGAHDRASRLLSGPLRDLFGGSLTGTSGRSPARWRPLARHAGQQL